METIKIKNSILEFIKNRETVKSKNLKFYQSQSEKGIWFRFFAKEGDVEHVFTVLKNDDAGRKRIARGFVDNSMTAAEKRQEQSEEKINEFIAEYFKQEFIINGQSYLFRWS